MCAENISLLRKKGIEMNKKNVTIFLMYSFSRYAYAMEGADIAEQMRKLQEHITAESTHAPVRAPDDIASLKAVIAELKESLREKETLLETAYSAMETFTKELREKEASLFQLQQETKKQQELTENLSRQLIETDTELSRVNQEYQSYTDSMRAFIREKRADLERRKQEIGINE